MAMNSFVMPHDLIRGQIGSYAYMQYEATFSLMMAELKKRPKKHIYTKQQNKK